MNYNYSKFDLVGRAIANHCPDPAQATAMSNLIHSLVPLEINRQFLLSSTMKHWSTKWEKQMLEHHGVDQDVQSDIDIRRASHV